MTDSVTFPQVHQRHLCDAGRTVVPLQLQGGILRYSVQPAGGARGVLSGIAVHERPVSADTGRAALLVWAGVHRGKLWSRWARPRVKGSFTWSCDVNIYTVTAVRHVRSHVREPAGSRTRRTEQREKKREKKKDIENKIKNITFQMKIIKSKVSIGKTHPSALPVPHPSNPDSQHTKHCLQVQVIFFFK